VKSTLSLTARGPQLGRCQRGAVPAREQFWSWAMHAMRRQCVSSTCFLPALCTERGNGGNFVRGAATWRFRVVVLDFAQFEFEVVERF